MKRCLPILAVLAISSSCASLSDMGSSVQEVEPEDVVSCQYINEVEGSSTLGGIFKERGPKIARAAMLNKAGRVGATHVVVIIALPETRPEKTDEQSWATAYIKAKAYKCPDSPQERDTSSDNPKP